MSGNFGHVILMANVVVFVDFFLKASSSTRELCKSMVNSRAKCLAISQVIRVKLYNSYLIFVSNFFFENYKKKFIIM